MFCKYKEPAPAEPKPERDTRYRVISYAMDRYGTGYAVVRYELVWSERQYATTSHDKDTADKIAALLNGDGR